MTQSAIALYLGESYATLKVFDTLSSSNETTLFEKSVYLPQTSLKNLLLQTKLACTDSEIKDIFVVTRYMDRLKTFRLGGSVVQVVPKGFENSYSLANTELQSLAAQALLLPVTAETTEAELKTELIRLKKINSEINKVVLQLPENLFSISQIDLIKTFFTTENFKIFSMANPYDLESVRKTLLNAGSEGTKEEMLSDIKDGLGENVQIHFWAQGQFTTRFESIDLYFSSHCFLKKYLEIKKLKQAFYFDLENWNLITSETGEKWQSPWGAINYSHPKVDEFMLSPYCELTVNSVGQLITSKSPPQFEPGPIAAGRSVKALILDAFADDLKLNKIISAVFPLLNSEAIQQKINTQFQILNKAQTLEEIRLTRNQIKDWLIFSVKTWILQNSKSEATEIFGDLAPFFHPIDSNKKNSHRLSDFSWTDQIINFVRSGNTAQ